MSRRVKVSDHAVLRYLERVEGVDVVAARRRLERLTRLAIEFELPGADHVRFGRFQIVVHNDVAVTVLAPHLDKVRKRRKP